MAETNKAPRVVNKSGTLKMDDKVAATKPVRDISGRKMGRRNRRDRSRADVGPKEFEEITIAVDRVSRTVAGGRRMRFKALVAVGNRKNKVGIGVAKGNDVTTAVSKASRKAKRSMVEFNMNGETICHECRMKVTGADVLMKPAAPGTGIIAGGTVRSIMGLTGVKNLISKSLGSTNKVNIAYAVIEGLKAQVPRSEWVEYAGKEKPAKEVAKVKKETAKAVKKSVSKETTEKTAKKATPVKETTKKTATSKESTAKKAVAKKDVVKKVVEPVKETTRKSTTAKKSVAKEDK